MITRIQIVVLAACCIAEFGIKAVRADILYVSNSGNNTIEKFTSSSVGSVFCERRIEHPESGLPLTARAISRRQPSAVAPRSRDSPPVVSARSLALAADWADQPALPLTARAISMGHSRKSARLRSSPPAGRLGLRQQRIELPGFSRLYR